VSLDLLGVRAILYPLPSRWGATASQGTVPKILPAVKCLFTLFVSEYTGLNGRRDTPGIILYHAADENFIVKMVLQTQAIKYNVMDYQSVPSMDVLYF
jgi:hypothetical protein